MGSSITLALLREDLAKDEFFVNGVWNNTLSMYFSTNAAGVIGKYMIYPEMRSHSGYGRPGLRADLVVGELVTRANNRVVIPRIVYEGKGGNRHSENAATNGAQLTSWMDSFEESIESQFTWMIGARGPMVWFWICDSRSKDAGIIPQDPSP